MTLIATSVTVTIGNRASGMLSLRGNIAARGRRCRRRGPIRGAAAAAPDPLAGRGGERAHARLRLGDVLVGVVGGAHERARGHVVEPELVGGPLERRELVGMPVAHDGQVLTVGQY